MPPPDPGTPPPAPPTGSADDKTMALVAHIGGGLTCIVAPLIIWLMKKDLGGFVSDQAKEALNFQISVGLCLVALMILSMVPFVGCLTVIAIPIVGIGSLVLAIIAGLKANEGVAYRYPISLRLVK
jgi:uncharacterized Tic20 family protein